MGLKRSRSCNDRDVLLQNPKRTRRVASDLQLDANDLVSRTELASPFRQTRGSENDIGQNKNGFISTRSGHKVGEYSEIVSPRVVGSNLPETLTTSIASWIEDLPAYPIQFDTMSQTPFKRPRSNSDASLQLSDSDNGNEARRSRVDVYKDPRYDRLIESKGTFMRNSVAGPLPEEITYCKRLLSGDGCAGLDEIELKDPVLDSDFLQLYVDLMQQSSELRLCVDLHARLVPSAEILSLQQGKIGDLQEGCNDRWLQAKEFLDKIPQPDRTVAFRASVFTDLERQKLGIRPGVRSLYAACEGMLFPFLTCEVKAGSEGLTTAKRANANSMAIALRGVVDLFRRANIEQDVHRRVLGITIAHNASTVELYGHFPEIDGQKTAFYQYRLRAFDYADRDGQDRYTCYKFVHNVYTDFSRRHLERLQGAIAKLGMLSKSDESANLDAEVNILTPTASDPGATSVKSAAPSGRGTSLKAQNTQLKQDVKDLQEANERQRQENQETKARLEELLSLQSSTT